MFNRKEIKRIGKANFFKHYWLAVLAGILATILAFGGSAFSVNTTISGPSHYASEPNVIISDGVRFDDAESPVFEITTDMDDINSFDIHVDEFEIMDPENIDDSFISTDVTAYSPLGDNGVLIAGAIIAALVGVALGLAFGLAIDAFLANPLILGSSKWFLRNGREEDAPAEALVYGFKDPYMNKVKVMFGYTWRVLAWSLLFIIPGIIKAYEYRMVQYIVCDDPDISVKDALRESREIMDGSKWAAFVLDLSFIGWDILSIFTLGLLQPFFVVPYKLSTNAALYEALSGHATNDKEAFAA